MRALYVSTFAFFLVIFAVFYLVQFATTGVTVEPQVLGESVELVEDSKDVNEKAIIGEINKLRVESGLGSLEYSSDLSIVASARVSDMVTRNYYSHTTPDGDSYVDLLSKYSSKSTHSCENLQLQSGSNFLDAVNAWKNSTMHLKCLKDNRNSKVAISYAPYGEPIVDSSNQLRQMYMFAMISSN